MLALVVNDDLGKTVYTYYAAISSINQREQQQQIELCRQSWQRQGWDFVVLNAGHARQHPWFELYSVAIKSVPTVNKVDYDYHCFLRWLAMAAVGGGLMIDYDVMNMGISSIDYFQGRQRLTVYEKHIPSVVYGTAEQYLEVCKKFFTFAVNKLYIGTHNGYPHASDMTMLERGFSSDEIDKLAIVKPYPTVSPLIHCANFAVKKCGLPKVKAMQGLLSELTG